MALASAAGAIWAGADSALAASSVHGAWSVDCNKAAETQETVCVASQRVATDPAGRKVVLGVMVQPVKDDPRPRITFRMSNKALKRAGIGIKIDDQPPARLKINTCDESVCEARGWLDAPLLAQMREGRLLRFAFFIDQRNQITYPVSLEGFDEAFKALQVEN